MKVKLNMRDILADHWGDSVQVTATVDLEDLFQCTSLDAQPEFDLDEILEENRMIGHVWTIADVHEMRPDLTDDQAWEVLKACARDLDSEQGISWETIAAAAQKLVDDEVNRVQLFAGAVERYTDFDPKTNLIDLLADAMLWCDAKSVSFDESLQTARTHFQAETREGDRS